MSVQLTPEKIVTKSKKHRAANVAKQLAQRRYDMNRRFQIQVNTGFYRKR